MTFMPDSRVASMAVMVEPPVVQTSSTMTTWAPSLWKPSRRRPVPWVFSALRTRKPWTRGRFVGRGAGGVVAPGAGAGGVGDEGVGSHGESADGFGLREVLPEEVVEDEAGEAAAFGVEGGGAAVDVVVGLLAAGEGEVAEAEGEGRDEIEEVGAVVGWHGFVRL